MVRNGHAACDSVTRLCAGLLGVRMSAASHRISRLEPYLDRPEPAPTLLKMLVGVQLAGFSEDAGLAQDQAAGTVGFSAATLSRIESCKGPRPPTESDVEALLELYTTAD